MRYIALVLSVGAAFAGLGMFFHLLYLGWRDER